jgi:DNA-directed RNA polymerase specialized sigma24 family protein
MSTEFALRNAAERAYLTAFLLTVNSQLAEAAVMKSIRDMDPSQASGEALFDTVLQTAIELERSGEFDTLEVDAAFPLELQIVANLPPLPRRCFVLHVLAGLPSELCARLLHLEIAQVKESTTIALSELPSAQTPCTIDT